MQLKTRTWVTNQKHRYLSYDSVSQKEDLRVVWRGEGRGSLLILLLSVACRRAPSGLCSHSKPSRAEPCWEQKCCNLKPEKRKWLTIGFKRWCLYLVFKPVQVLLGFPGRSQCWKDSIFSCSHSSLLSLLSHQICTQSEAAFLCNLSLQNSGPYRTWSSVSHPSVLPL